MAVGDQPAQRREIVPLRVRAGRQHDGRRGVVDAGRVPGGDRAFLGERGPEAAEVFPGHVLPGSGVSLGHPIGATGTILAVKALYELRRTGGRYGLVTMCIGGGQGIAAIFERL